MIHAGLLPSALEAKLGCYSSEDLGSHLTQLDDLFPQDLEEVLEIPDQDSDEELDNIIEQIAYRDLDMPVVQMQEPEGETHPSSSVSTRGAAESLWGQ